MQCVLRDNKEDDRNKTVFHNTTPDRQDQDQDQDRFFGLFLPCPKIDVSDRVTGM